MGLMQTLGPGPVGLDTALFIYLIEEDPEWIERVLPLFGAIAAGSLHAVTSELTLLETLVVPFREGDRQLARAYESILTRSAGLTLVPIDRSQLRAAAHLRAARGVKTPDAIQLAAALSARCTSFVTNDRRLPSLAQLRVVQASELPATP